MLHALLYFQEKQEKYRLELSVNYQEVIEVWGMGEVWIL